MEFTGLNGKADGFKHKLPPHLLAIYGLVRPNGLGKAYSKPGLITLEHLR